VRDTINVTVEDYPIVDFTVSDTLICAGLELHFDNLSSGSAAHYDYKWDFGDGNVSSLFKPSHHFNIPGLHTVRLEARSKAGCGDTMSKAAYINVNHRPFAKFYTDPGAGNYEHPELKLVNLSTDAVTYAWDFGDQQSSSDHSPDHIYKDTGSYRIILIAATAAGCYDTAEAKFRIHEIYRFYIPSAFSPDGDQVNESFEYRGRGILQVRTFIYNRWGEQVYFTDKLGEFWDGTVNGKAISPDGVYYYRIEVKDFQKRQHVYSGALTLLK
jgi:gliding motility-associated-like protein